MAAAAVKKIESDSPAKTTKPAEDATARLRSTFAGELEEFFERFMKEASLGDVILLRNILMDHEGERTGERVALPGVLAESCFGEGNYWEPVGRAEALAVVLQKQIERNVARA